MRTNFTAALAVAALSASEAGAAPSDSGAALRLRLSCDGIQTTTETETTRVEDHRKDEDGRRHTREIHRQRTVRVPRHVSVDLADGAGRIRIPAGALSDIFAAKSVDGWFPLTALVVGDDRITARVKLNVFGSSGVRIDRRTGEIEIGSEYEGSCEKSETPLDANRF